MESRILERIIEIHPIDVAAMAGNSPNTIYKHYYKNVDQKQVDAKMERTLGCM